LLITQQLLIRDLPREQLLQLERKVHWLHRLRWQRQLSSLQLFVLLEFKQMPQKEIRWKLLLIIKHLFERNLPWQQLLQLEREDIWLHRL
jgi:hypothetical protein